MVSVESMTILASYIAPTSRCAVRAPIGAVPFGGFLENSFSELCASCVGLKSGAKNK